METFVVLTGLSGAGKTTGMHALEDIGFFTVDNLPPQLWGNLIEQARLQGSTKIAVGVDVRTRHYIADVLTCLTELSKLNVKADLIFLDASDDVLVKRYNLTRRTHPLGKAPLSDDIATEREVLGPLRAISDLVLDTSRTSAKELVEKLRQHFDNERAFHLRIISFGFKRGIPIDADNIIDLRALPNPYYDANLRPIDGRDKRVQSYVFQGQTLLFYPQMRDFILQLSSMAEKSGRSSYTIAVGCTGGQHRSVAIGERLANDLAEHFTPLLEHRDVDLALAEHAENRVPKAKNNA